MGDKGERTYPSELVRVSWPAVRPVTVAGRTAGSDGASSVYVYLFLALIALAAAWRRYQRPEA